MTHSLLGIVFIKELQDYLRIFRYVSISRTYPGAYNRHDPKFNRHDPHILNRHDPQYKGGLNGPNGYLAG